MGPNFNLLDTQAPERISRNVLALQAQNEQQQMQRMRLQGDQEDRQMRNVLAQQGLQQRQQEHSMQMIPKIAQLLYADPSDNTIDALAQVYSEATGQDVSQFAAQLKQMPPEQRKQVALSMGQKYDPKFQAFNLGDRYQGGMVGPDGIVTVGQALPIAREEQRQSPPSGYQWAADGATMQPIPGGPYDQTVTPKRKEAPAGYRYTETGDLEAIPGGPADAKTRALDEKTAAGMDDLDITMGALRDAYNRLESGGGITSIEKGPIENAGASISSSSVGQAAGKLFGTKNQSARNEIAMARPTLLSALMRATGMSARSIDSNAELKLWMTTATDPELDVEANRKALDNIERKYIKRGWQREKSMPPASGGPPAGAAFGGKNPETGQMEYFDAKGNKL
jgi:hypothetical protein